MRAQSVRNDSRNNLTCLESALYKGNVPRSQDIIAALKAQFEEDSSALEKIFDEQNELRKAYARFRALDDDAKRRTKRLRQTVALLSATRNWSAVKALGKLGIDTVVMGLPLWESMAEILRHTQEIQIVDLHMILRELKIETSRQAIESALETHAELFEIKRVGREKFVSLKGE